jgi:hypothetical protein
MLSALNFDEGKRYADFNASTDRVAEYGLAALVAGAAAKKLGFFALAFAFLAKFAKVGILAAAAIGAGLFKFFGKKQKDAEPVVDTGNAYESAPPAEPLRAQVADVNPFGKPAEPPPPGGTSMQTSADKK